MLSALKNIISAFINVMQMYPFTCEDNYSIAYND